MTDVVASTALWEHHGDAVRESLAFHDEVLAELCAPAAGLVWKHAGDGAYAVFERPAEAVVVAQELQERMAAAELDVPLEVRVGLHTGEAEPADDEYLGPAINRAVRVCDAAHGRQILMSAATATVVGDTAGAPVEPLGEYWLKGIADPQPLYQIGPGRFPPPRSAAVAEVVLPTWDSSLVGREKKITDVAGLLDRHRMVTVVGIGGIGKTRLAVAVAHHVVSTFPDGVWFVDLTLVGADREVRDAIARALRLPAGVVQESSTADASGFLRDRRALLLLDNCEHVIGGAASEAARLVAACPDLRILATSRQILRCSPERLVALEPLPAASDGVELFVDRARGTGASLKLDEGTRSAVASLCARLDGIPLAIELAAARCRHADPADLLDALGDRFEVLTDGDRSVPRHQTLRATLDWSQELLGDPARVLLRRLAVFPQSFTFDAVRAVAGDVGDHVMTVLGELVDQSLIVFQTDGRYRLLETVRAYEAEMLAAAGETETVERRHRDWARELCHRFHPADTSTHTDADEGVLADSVNLVHALRWSLRHEELDIAADLSRHMWAIFQQRGELEWAAGLYRRALREHWAGDADIHADIATLVLNAEIWTGDLSDPRAISDEVAGTILAAPNPERGLAVAAMLHAAVSRYRRGANPEGALGLLDHASALAERSGSVALVQGVRMARAGVHMHDGAYVSALEIVEDRDVRPFTTAQGTRVGALALLGRHREALEVLAAIDERQRRGSETLWALLEATVASALDLPDVRQHAARVHRRGLAEHRTPVMVRNVAASLAVILVNLGETERARQLAARVGGVVTYPGLTQMFEDALRSLGLPKPTQARLDGPGSEQQLADLVEDELAWLTDHARPSEMSVEAVSSPPT